MDGWLLVQREDAPQEDRDRVAALASTLGDRAEVRPTGGVDDLDDAIGGLDGRTLVVCGGDGSMHLAANRLHTLGRLDDVTAALYPAGTGNDLAHTLDLPSDPDRMAGLLRDGAPIGLDLLRVGDHAVAVNAVHAGVGVDAAERSADLPDDLGALAYPLGAVLAGFRAEGFAVRVELDGSDLAPDEGDDTLMVLVMNGRTIGGGHHVAPEADPSDGHLDVVVCHATGLAARAALGVAITRGTHLDRPDVAVGRGSTVVLRDTAVTLNVDGELWVDEPVVDLEVGILPGALTLLRSLA